ncbi:MAG: hypothetical protein KDE51_17540 [Anaerolineales bacterium]|nr:hypothetical protein [Anaerolineales bacterium]
MNEYNETEMRKELSSDQFSASLLHALRPYVAALLGYTEIIRVEGEKLDHIPEELNTAIEEAQKTCKSLEELLIRVGEELKTQGK